MTENGYGKRTSIDEYRLTSRGAKGVKTIAFTERRACWPARWSCASTRSSSSSPRTAWSSAPACAASTATAARRRACEVMNLREGDAVSAVALVVETERDGGDGADERGCRRTRVDGTAADEGVSERHRVDATTPEDERRGDLDGVRLSACGFATLRITRERGWSEVE